MMASKFGVEEKVYPQSLREQGHAQKRKKVELRILKKSFSFAVCRGCVHCLKLSPNLRRQPKGAAGQAADASVLQLDAIFSVALKSMVLEAEA